MSVNILNLGVPPAAESVPLSIGDAVLQVSPKIPYEKVIEAIEWSVNSILDDRTFISAPLHAIIQEVAILKFYTDLDTSGLGAEYFALTDFYEWFDIIQAHDLPSRVREIIEPKQLQFFTETLEKTIQSIVAYRNSAAGIIDRLTAQNTKDNLEMQTVLEQLDEPQYAKLLQVMSALGQDGAPLTK